MVRVSLTEKGKVALRPSKKRKSTHKIMQSLNEEERKQFTKCLMKILDASQKELGIDTGEWLPVA